MDENRRFYSCYQVVFGRLREKKKALRYLVKVGAGWVIGLLCGAVTVVKGIQFCLKHYRVQSVYTILGMMMGSFCAVVRGSTTLKQPLPAMSFGSFRILFALIGIVLVLGMQKLCEKNEVAVRAGA